MIIAATLALSVMSQKPNVLEPRVVVVWPKVLQTPGDPPPPLLPLTPVRPPTLFTRPPWPSPYLLPPVEKPPPRFSPEPEPLRPL